MEIKYDYFFTINILGDRGVGKTQIINRYVFDTFESSHIYDADKTNGKVIY